MSTGKLPSLSADTEIVYSKQKLRSHLLAWAKKKRKEVQPLTDEPVPATMLRVLLVPWDVLSPSLSLSELQGEEHGEEEGEEQGEELRMRSASR